MIVRSLDRERGLPRPGTFVSPRQPSRPGLGDHRVRHRLRLAARHRRSNGRPDRQAKGVLHGLGVFTLGSALCGVAPSVAVLVVGRLIQGAGAAALLPSSLGLLLAAYGPERRSQIVALWAGVGALAVATGPSLGAALITAGGWRWAFFVNLPVGAIALRDRPTGAGGPSSRRHPPSSRLSRSGAGEHVVGRAGSQHLRGSELGLDQHPSPVVLRRGADHGRRSS